MSTNLIWNLRWVCRVLKPMGFKALTELGNVCSLYCAQFVTSRSPYEFKTLKVLPFHHPFDFLSHLHISCLSFTSPEFEFDYEFESRVQVRVCHMITAIITSQHSSLLNEQLLFITKCDRVVLQSATAILLQSATSVRCYYKMWQYNVACNFYDKTRAIATTVLHFIW